MEININMMEKIKKLITGKYKSLFLVFVCLLVVGILIAYNVITKRENIEETVINRGQVAKSVSLLFHSKNEISKLEDKYFNGDEEWYVKYMNMMYQDTYFTKNQIKPVEREVLKSFTYSDLDKLFTNMGVVDKKLLAYVKNNNAANVITLKEWNKILQDLRTICDKQGNISQVQMTVVGTISNVPTFEPWVAATDMGVCGFDGLTLDYCIDKKIEVLMRDDEIITVLDTIDKNVTYTNAWVMSVNNGIITAFIEGARREFYIDNKNIAYNNVTADIVLENKKLTNYIIKDNYITGKVLSLTDSEIEIEGHGRLSLDKDVKVYSLYGELLKKSKADIMIGYDVQRFIVADNHVTAVIIDRDIEALNIRVLLKNTGYEDIYHDSFSVQSTSGISVRYGDKVEMFGSDESITIDSSSSYIESGRVTIMPNSSGEKLTVTSIKRNGESPSYRGSIDLIKQDDKLIVINELSMEEYLYSVVPSEMPWSYSEEALKAQAVCARTYAYKHIINSGYSQYGAHVDDSTSYQVYNVSGEQDATTKAINDTKGQIILHDGQPISAYFFSTSCGSTTNSMIWGSELPYIKGTLLTENGNEFDLTVNDVFETFIKTGYKTFDSEYPWYRWEVEMTLEDITKSINESISVISENNIKNVSVLQEDGSYSYEKVVGVGTVKKIEEGTRNIGGVLDYVTIFGTEKTVRVYREYNIRKLFNVSGLTITRNNGEAVDTMSMLPSAYVFFDENTMDGLLTSYTIIGGGYGHGAGMSQNGANNMAKSGYTYDKILEFFYNDIDIESIQN